MKRAAAASFAFASGFALAVSGALGRDAAPAQKPAPAAPAPAAAAPAGGEVKPDDKPRIDVVFCIDRSGSMGGVIETAKKKVWSIVNEIAKAKPAPELRIGLIGYGEGERVIHQLDLTGDLDEVYKQLTTYRDDSQT